MTKENDELNEHEPLARYIERHPRPWRIEAQAVGGYGIQDARGQWLRDWDVLFALVVSVVNAESTFSGNQRERGVPVRDVSERRE